MAFKLRSAPGKKPIVVESYEEAQALRVLCLEHFGREIEVSGGIPIEFCIDNYYYYRFNHWHQYSKASPAKRVYRSPDLIILGMDLANFEAVDYKVLLQPLIDSNFGLVHQYRCGNEKALNSLMGQFLKEHKGHDAKAIKTALAEMLA